MKISADFTVIPDAFAKAAPPENCIDGTPIVSFPFYIDELDPSVQFLHWEFVDPDSIPVCGFQWNHWSLANLPVDALMYDFNDSHALAIPADFSRTVSAMIPETVQGRTSAASPLLKGRSAIRPSPCVTTVRIRPTGITTTTCTYGAPPRLSMVSIKASGSTRWNARCVIPVRSRTKALSS